MYLNLTDMPLINAFYYKKSYLKAKLYGGVYQKYLFKANIAYFSTKMFIFIFLNAAPPPGKYNK